MLRFSKIFTSRWRNESNSQDEKHLSGCSQSGCSQIRNMNFLGFESNVVTKSHITILILRRKKVLGGWFFICRGLMPSTSYRWLALDGGCRCRLCSIWQAAPAKGLSCREGCRYKRRILIQIKCWYFNLWTANIKLGSIPVSEDDEGVLKSCKVFAARLRWQWEKEHQVGIPHVEAICAALWQSHRLRHAPTLQLSKIFSTRAFCSGNSWIRADKDFF